MFLAINLNAANAKKRKKATERSAERHKPASPHIIMPDGVQEEALALETATHNSNIDNTVETAVNSKKCINCQHLVLGYDQISKRAQKRRRASSVGDDALTYTELSRLPTLTVPAACACKCNCIYNMKQKPFATIHRDSLVSTTTTIETTTKPTSLFTVYMCLGILTFALATLAILFYSHVTTTTTRESSLSIEEIVWREHAQKTTTAPPTSIINKIEFHALFQHELQSSKHILSEMVAELLLQLQQSKPQPINITETFQKSTLNIVNNR